MKREKITYAIIGLLLAIYLYQNYYMREGMGLGCGDADPFCGWMIFFIVLIVLAIIGKVING